MTLTTMYDLPKTAGSAPTITVYGPPDCPNCDKATRLFDHKAIAYTKVDLEAGDVSHRYVTEDLGHQQAPVIVVELENGRTVHWGGHRMDMLMALVKLCTKGIVSTDTEHQEASR